MTAKKPNCFSVGSSHVNSNHISDFSPLSGLINLRWLDLGGNSISDLSVLSDVISRLTRLERLILSGNNISDISALSGLTNLRSLSLSSNNISDLSPLVANTGLGSGDRVDVRNNPLNTTSINAHIPTLQSRGVEVRFGALKPAVEKIEQDIFREMTELLEGGERRN